ncbi:MAG: hypothetical protein ALECFALPRED_007351 [Alectoria fallacina]|uniref:Uncharacterized protein n=1 Tax=Alectoria fallacina TaxID=1903189 RepID=A0A8H3IRI7_9LECA|nr:MAG: hypothetical protein ALECFALPRED_007351 [Alectoria fallacina]
MEIQYQKDDDEDEFVMVERLSDSLRLGEELTTSAQTTAVGEKNAKMADADSQARCTHLPAVPAPNLMQTPQNIPPLYPFRRTNVYVLISPEAAQGSIKSVILKGSSIEDPFEVKIPIEVLSECGETIHQFAAKKALFELEKGRGWLMHAEDEKGVLIKENYSARFQPTVEGEAVRLGIQYQIAGKFTSFVATRINLENPENTLSRKAGIVEEVESSLPAYYAHSQPGTITNLGAPASGGLFSSVSAARPSPISTSMSGSEFGASLFSGSTSGSNFGASASSGLFGSISTTSASLLSTSTSGQAPHKQVPSRVAPTASSYPLQEIIALQTFEGYWKLEVPLLEVVGLSAEHKAPQGVDSKVWATVLAITSLEGKMAGDKEAWDTVVEKARAWLEGTEESVSKQKWTLAEQLNMGADQEYFCVSPGMW